MLLIMETMRAVIQRVKEAEVTVQKISVGKIGPGLVVLVGVDKKDSKEDAHFLAEKIVHLRIFEDKEGKMNLSAQESGAEFLVVSQFTLLGDCRRGRRPSFDAAADPAQGEELYNAFVEQLKQKNGKVETGRFRAMMEVHLINDGPVTFVMDSK